MSNLDNKNVAKASIWYLVSTFVSKAVSMLTTPFFARILTTDEYGYYSNFATWMSLITIIAGLSLHSTLLRARFDFKNEFQKYIFSILILGSLFTTAIFGMIAANADFFIKLFVLDKKYLIIMFCYIFVSPAYDMFLNEQRYEYKYKLVVALTLFVVLANVGLSFVLIAIMDDCLLARILGSYLPLFIIAAILYMRYFIKARNVTIVYWKYALPIAIPYIFHLLSSNILGSSDRTMITNICGATDNALYSMCYNLAMIVNFMWSSLNNAFAPWMTEKMNTKDYGAIKKMSYPYILIFAYLLIGIMLIAPEAILILGGEKYYNAIFVVPPVMYGYFFMLIYSLYVNIEQFEKKTIGMAVATAIAAVTNIALNAVFIPIFGYIAAAYTTLIGYVLLTVIHFLLVKYMGLEKMFDTRFIIFGAILVGILTVVITMLYSVTFIRWVVIMLYALSILIITIKNRKTILRCIKK